MRFAAALALLFLLLQASFAMDAMAAYVSNTGSCGIACPKVRLWNETTQAWNGEIELGSTGTTVREARIAISPRNQKAVVVSLNDFGEIDVYVSWDGKSFAQTRNLTRIWNSSPATHYRGFDVDFESSSNGIMLVTTANIISTTCDLYYWKILANETAASGAGTCIDDSVASDVVYTWVAIDRNGSSSSNQMAVVGFDSTGNDASAWIWSGSSWGNQVEITTAGTATGGYEAVGVAFSADNTKAMAIAPTGTAGALNGQYWNGATWTAANPGDIAVGNEDIRWVRIVEDPATDDMMATAVTSLPSLISAYWSGSAWTANTSMDSAVDSGGTRPADFAWNITGSGGKMMWGTTSGSLTSATRSGAWGGASSLSGFNGTAAFMLTKTNPNATSSIRYLGLRLGSDRYISPFNYSGITFGTMGGFILGNATVTTYEASDLEFYRASDVTGPFIGNISANMSTAATNTNVCVNASLYDQNSAPLDRVLADILFPDGSRANVTLNSTGCNAGTGEDNWWGGAVNVGSTGGTLNVTRIYANDSFGNLAWNASYSLVTVTGGAVPDPLINVTPGSSTATMRVENITNQTYVTLTVNTNATNGSWIITWQNISHTSADVNETNITGINISKRILVTITVDYHENQNRTLRFNFNSSTPDANNLSVNVTMGVSVPSVQSLRRPHKLNLSNFRYNIIANISTDAEFALNITASNVTLEGQGFTVTGGIFVDGTDNTVLGGIVLDPAYGLWINNTNNSLFENLTLEAITEVGILVSNNSNNNTVRNFSINSSNYGIDITIIANNNTLDCAGRQIWTSSTNNSVRINGTTATNNTIKNCLVNQTGSGSAVQIDTSASSNTLRNLSVYAAGAGSGVIFTGNVADNWLIGSSVYANSGRGVYFVSGAVRNNMTNSTASSTSSFGAHVVLCNLVSDSILTSGSSLGMRVQSTTDCALRNNTITSGTNRALDLVGSIRTNYTNNTITAGTSGDAIRLDATSVNNTIQNNSLMTQSGTGIYFLSGANRSIIINNTIRSNASTAILIEARAIGNLFYHNQINGTRWANVQNESNYFNTTVSGVAQGNYYHNISLYDVTDTDSDGWGDGGAKYPVNSANIPQWIGNATDWGPAVTSPNITVTPGNQSAMIVVISDPSGSNTTTLNITLTGANGSWIITWQNFTHTTAQVNETNITGRGISKSVLVTVTVNRNETQNRTLRFDFNSSMPGGNNVSVNITTRIITTSPYYKVEPFNSTIYVLRGSYNTTNVTFNFTHCGGACKPDIVWANFSRTLANVNSTFSGSDMPDGNYSLLVNISINSDETLNQSFRFNLTDATVGPGGRQENVTFYITVIMVEPGVSLAFNVSVTRLVANGSNNLTRAIEYNATQPTTIKVNASLVDGKPTDKQNATVAVFNYTNAGSVSLNITLSLNESLPAGLTLKVGWSANAWEASCTNTPPHEYPSETACIKMPVGGYANVTNLTAGSSQAVWVWADFASVAAGSSFRRTFNHTSYQDN